MNAQEIIKALHTMSQDDLILINKSLIAIAKAKRSAVTNPHVIKSQLAKAQFSRGDKVEWTSKTNFGEVMNGTVEKISSKNIKVLVVKEGVVAHWVVSPTLLRKAV